MRQKTALHNANRIGVVTVPQQQMFTVDYSTMCQCTPIQNPLKDLISQVEVLKLAQIRYTWRHCIR